MKFTLWINIPIPASVNHQCVVKEFSFSDSGEGLVSFFGGCYNAGKLSRYERLRQKVNLEDIYCKRAGLYSLIGDDR